MARRARRILYDVVMRTHWIDGKWTSSSGNATRTIENPATLEALEEVVEGNAEDVRRAVAIAHGAQRTWRKMPAIERGKLLHETAQAMREDRAMLSELLTREGGKPRIENLDEFLLALPAWRMDGITPPSTPRTISAESKPAWRASMA